MTATYHQRAAAETVADPESVAAAATVTGPETVAIAAIVASPATPAGPETVAAAQVWRPRPTTPEELDDARTVLLVHRLDPGTGRCVVCAADCPCPPALDAGRLLAEAGAWNTMPFTGPTGRQADQAPATAGTGWVARVVRRARSVRSIRLARLVRRLP